MGPSSSIYLLLVECHRHSPYTAQAHTVDTQAHAASLDGLDSYSTLLDSYPDTRQLLDSYLTGSTGKALTAPRQRPRQRLDGAPTARRSSQSPRSGLKPQQSHNHKDKRDPGRSGCHS